MHLTEMKSAQVDSRWYHVTWKFVINTGCLLLLSNLDGEFSVCSLVGEVDGGVM
jgi:hypothetical protein